MQKLYESYDAKPCKKVQQYNDDKNPLFQKFKLDSQLQDIFNPRVTLKSGGYLIIDQTEA